MERICTQTPPPPPNGPKWFKNFTSCKRKILMVGAEMQKYMTYAKSKNEYMSTLKFEVGHFFNKC